MKFKPKAQASYLMKLVQASSPTVLTAVGVVGVVGTAVLVGKAAYNARDILLDYEEEIAAGKEANLIPDLSVKEKALLTWKLYIPAAGVGSLTIAAIIASNRIHARRLAALAAGYAILSKDFEEHRDKAYEMLGIKKADELKKDITSGKVAVLPGNTEILPVGKTWFLDSTTMQPFPATMEDIKYAQNEINHRINNQQACSLNDFYDSLGQPNTTIGDILGWDNEHLIELNFTPVLTEDRGAVTMFSFAKEPKPNFWRG